MAGKMTAAFVDYSCRFGEQQGGLPFGGVRVGQHDRRWPPTTDSGQLKRKGFHAGFPTATGVA
jgi:hypothetical protein